MILDFIKNFFLKNKSTNKKLKLNTDYKVTYKNNKNTGTATVTIKGIGIYGGTITQKFKIVKPTLKYRAYTQTNAWDKAWQVSPISTAINTKVAGVKINKRLQAIQMSLSGVEGSVQYRLYRQKDGWSAWGDSSKKTVIGGKADVKRTEAIQIKLTGQIKTLYDVKISDEIKHSITQYHRGDTYDKSDASHIALLNEVGCIGQRIRRCGDWEHHGTTCCYCYSNKNG